MNAAVLVAGPGREPAGGTVVVPAFRPRARRLGLAFALLGAAAWLAWFVAVRQGLLFLIGAGMGATLVGCGFGFTGGWRRLIEDREPGGVLAQLLLLALAAVFCMPLLALYPGDLGAALGPPGVSLLVGAFVFGVAMPLARGCGSGTLAQAGAGTPINMAILPLFACGSFAGSATLDNWLALGSLPAWSLVEHMGTGQAIFLTLLGLAALAAVVLRRARPGAPRREGRLLLAALLLAVLAAVHLLVAGQPWGIVYGTGLWGAKIATAAGFFDPAANAFWSQAIHRDLLAGSVFLDVTSVTNFGVLAGAFLVAAGRPREPGTKLAPRQWLAGLVAGFLLGYGSRLAFGCNIGALLGGISTGSLHGWLWLAAAFPGAVLGLRLRRRCGL